MKLPLIYKIILLNIPALVIVAGGVLFAVEYQAGIYFDQLMREYHISPERPHALFVDRLRISLLVSLGLALIVLICVAALVTWRLLRPIHTLMSATERLAAGDYSSQAAIKTGDEIEELGKHFDRMTQRLSELESLRKRVITDAAHELRTPLTNLRGYLEAIREGVLKVNDKTLRILEDETFRMIALVERWLQLAKADASAVSVQAKPVQARELLEKALLLARPGFIRKNFDLEIDLPPATVEIVADPDLIIQVLANILGNVEAHAPNGADVAVTAEKSGQSVNFRIENSGSPIDEAHLPFLFERFYRADSARTRGNGNSAVRLGLGLSIAKEIMAAHHQTISVTSADNKTCFEFSLPVKAP